MEEIMEIMEIEEVRDLTWEEYRMVAHNWDNRTVFTLDGKWVKTITRIPDGDEGYWEITEWASGYSEG